MRKFQVFHNSMKGKITIDKKMLLIHIEARKTLNLSTKFLPICLVTNKYPIY